ncbi:HNH endonuclease [Streptomyces vinaceus]|uniref:HNH endonuclease n=1 Tax=Streptomyces vinaceus TaxID=1960 RepID=UPI0036C0EBAE
MTAKELPASDWRRSVYGRSQIGGVGQRRRPRMADRNRIIEQQGYVCLYCELPIGTFVLRGRRRVMLVANWDHFIPHAYSQANPASNWVLACHVCNSIKTARMFDSVESARQLILPRRIVKGYESVGATFHRLGLEKGTRSAIQ